MSVYFFDISFQVNKKGFESENSFWLVDNLLIIIMKSSRLSLSCETKVNKSDRNIKMLTF